MKIYTQAEFNDIPRDNKGIKHCPNGDYSEIKFFGERCSFSERCSFGEYCSFGEWCSFGEYCSFGERCSFSERCSFGEYCSFSEWCSFGERCSFGMRCSFGEWCSFDKFCSFGEYCSFGKRCSFSEWCSFGERCSFGYRCFFENVGVAKAGYPFAAYIGAGSRQGSKTYFFNLEAGIYVRCGCFLGTLDEFIAKVEETHGDSHAGQEYKAIAELIRDKFS